VPALGVASPSRARSQAGGLILGATSRENLSPSLVFELLHRIAKVIKARAAASLLAPPLTAAQDYCGVLSEESLRKNFVLVYELLDEVVDYGRAHAAALQQHALTRRSYGQSTSTEALKASIFNDPVAPPQGACRSASRSPPLSAVQARALNCRACLAASCACPAPRPTGPSSTACLTRAARADRPSRSRRFSWTSSRD